MTYDEFAEFAGLSGLERAAAMRAKATRLLTAADHCEKGASGERRVAELLRPLANAPGWRVMHDRQRRIGSLANIDHIVVGPNGVTVIDAKNWSGNVTFGRDVLRQNGYRRDDEVEGAWRDAAQLATELGVPVRATLCLTGSGLPDASGTTAAGVGVMRPEDLLAFVRHGPIAFAPDHTADVAAVIDRLHPPRSATVRSQGGSRGLPPRPHGAPMRQWSATIVPSTPSRTTPSRSASGTRSSRPSHTHAPRRASAPVPGRGHRRLSPELRKLAFALLFLAALPLYPLADRMATRAITPILSHEIQTAVKGAAIAATPTPHAP